MVGDTFPLFSKARSLVENLRLDDPLPVPCLSNDDAARIEHPTDLAHISTRISKVAEGNANELHTSVVWLEVMLRNKRGIGPGPASVDQAKLIQTWLVTTVLPDDVFCARKPFGDDLSQNDPALDRFRFRMMSLAALRLLATLSVICPQLVTERDVRVFTFLSTYSDPNDLWTSPTACEIALDLLDRYTGSLKAHQGGCFLATASELLTNIVPNGFTKGDFPRAITQEGRKAMYIEPGNPQPGERSTFTKPWKYHEPYVVSVFRWSLAQLNRDTIEGLWTYIVPPILALLDDEDTKSKSEGCILLQMTLQRLPDDLLRRTGLGEVMEEALLPLLFYLPPLTPEEESLSLLREAYSTLLLLAKVRCPGNITLDTTGMWDKVMRRGIFNSFANVGERPVMAIFLLQKMAQIIDDMGIFATKHARIIVRILVDILSDPFSVHHTKLLISAIATLTTLILNVWPRVDHHKADILKGIAICWSRLESDDAITNEDRQKIRAGLSEVTKLFIASLVNQPGSQEEIHQVLQASPNLRGLV